MLTADNAGKGLELLASHLVDVIVSDQRASALANAAADDMLIAIAGRYGWR